MALQDRAVQALLGSSLKSETGEISDLPWKPQPM